MSLFHSFIDPSIKRILQREPKKPARLPKLDYITSLAMRDGKPYSFAGHEDLLDIATDTADVVIVRKAAQKGVTELMLRLQFWLASQGYNSAYFLSSVRYLRIQVQTRVEPLIRANPDLLKAIAPPESEQQDDTNIPRKYRSLDNLHVKRLYNAYLVYLGLQGEADVRSYPLDAIFVDEVETLKPNLVDAIEERLLHSTLKWQRWFSQPKAVGYGIDERFQLTDQRHLLFTCTKCSAEFTLEEHFPHIILCKTPSGTINLAEINSIDLPQGEWHYACPKCHTVLNLHSLDLKRRYVPKYPSRNYHGYHLTQLYSPTNTASDIARKYAFALTSTKRMERFWNSILGLPYAGGDTQPIAPDKLHYADTDDPAQEGHTCCGIDVGDTLHLVVLQQHGSKLRIISAHALKGVNKWRDAENLILAYKCKVVGINAMPYKDSAKALARSLKKQGIQSIIIYDTASNSTSLREEDKEYGDPVYALSVPRTDLMDGTVSALLSGAILMPPRHLPITEQLLKHLQNYIVEQDPDTGKREYARGREDHFGRALDYARTIARLAPYQGLISPHLDPKTLLVDDSDLKPQQL